MARRSPSLACSTRARYLSTADCNEKRGQTTACAPESPERARRRVRTPQRLEALPWAAAGAAAAAVVAVAAATRAAQEALGGWAAGGVRALTRAALFCCGSGRELLQAAGAAQPRGARLGAGLPGDVGATLGKSGSVAGAAAGSTATRTRWRWPCTFLDARRRLGQIQRVLL